MLPPVRATLSSFVEYQNPGQQPMLRQRIDVAGNAAHADGATSLPISGGRLDIMSLSAQLQLAQGFSIFAETIGKLIRLPRRDGEALLDYARRIMEAVKAMTPAQQAALEKVLNQLVKGVSLKLLTEILNNPGGPDAARLAMRLEAAQLLGRDPANSVVSSYRQNAGAELPPSQTPQARAQGQAPAPAENLADPPAGAATGQQAAAEQAATATDDGETAPETVASNGATEAAPPENPAGTAHTETAETPQAQTATAQAEGASAAEPISEETAETASAATQEAQAEPGYSGKGKSEQSAVVQGERRTASSPVFYDGPALARLSQRGMEQQANTAQGRPTTVAAMTEWLAEVFADGDTDLFEPLPTATEPPVEEQTLEELFGRDTLAAQKQATADMAPRARPGQAAEETQAQTTRQSAAAAPNGQPATHATELAEQLALPFVLPQQFRDGVPLPYVAYPPEERERDPEERKAKPVTETDEDGEEQQSAAGQHSHEENQAREDAPDEDEQQRADNTEDEGRPNDLYWRMAGWN